MPDFRTPMRDPAQFASAFTRWVYYQVPLTMYFGDVDGVAYAKARRCLRVFEWKYPDAWLSNGQRAILPVLDRMIRQQADGGLLAPDSGAYVVRGTPPFTAGAVIEQPWRMRRVWTPLLPYS
jgi:hypothetical protein